MSAADRNGEDLKYLAGLDRIIHEPGRLAVVSYLSVVEEADFLFLMDQTGLTRGNLSSHMAKLEGAGYVEVDKTFVEKIPRTTYRLTEAGRAAFRDYRRGLLASLGDPGR
jgi:DNA-binding MarR family transcriptional regulator